MPLPNRSPRLAFATTLLAVSYAVASVPAAALSPAAKRPVEPKVLQTQYGTTEVGLLDDAAYRIDIPPNWNHALVVFYHGYALRPASFHIAEHLVGQQQPFFDRHYAVIQSAYSQTGWALAQAYPETESLRRYFIKKYGMPRETYAAGGSMGGELVSITMELNPKPYVGGLDLCGAVGPTDVIFTRRFAVRAAFDYYFPNVMPPLVPVPEDFQDTIADRDKALAALRSNPAAATALRNLAGLHTDLDLAHDIAYFTFVVGDIQHRAGGNAFDTTSFPYYGTSPSSSAGDAELNAKVKRYTADPRAHEYLVRHYSPSGRLGRPMLALHTVYDPIVQTFLLPMYHARVQAAGAENNFVQQFVDADGHCNFTQDEIGTAFDELVRWTHGGPRPAPGMLKP